MNSTDQILVVITTTSQLEETLRKALNQIFPEKPMIDLMSEKMTVLQASQYIQVSYKTMCSWINGGFISVHGKGRKRFLIKSELLEQYKKMNSVILND